MALKVLNRAASTQPAAGRVGGRALVVTAAHPSLRYPTFARVNPLLQRLRALRELSIAPLQPKLACTALARFAGLFPTPPFHTQSSPVALVAVPGLARCMRPDENTNQCSRINSFVRSPCRRCRRLHGLFPCRTPAERGFNKYAFRRVSSLTSSPAQPATQTVMQVWAWGAARGCSGRGRRAGC